MTQFGYVELTGADLSGFLSALGFETEPPVEEVGAFHNEHRAYVAWEALRKLQAALDTNGVTEGDAFMQPRITVRDHSDVHVLLAALDSAGLREKEALFQDWAAYGIGSTVHSEDKLQERSTALITAWELRGELQRIHNGMQLEKKLAEEAAETLRNNLTEDNSRYAQLNDIPYAELVALARNTWSVRQHIDRAMGGNAEHGDKIRAIKELRIIAGCGLRNAKLAVEGAMAELRNDI